MAFSANEHMIQLKGKDYLQVAWRLVWFREDHPDWSIDAECIDHDQDHAIFKAVICDDNGIQKSSGHGSECRGDFGDFLEKAETKAVGRALAMLGYGTQFAGVDLEENMKSDPQEEFNEGDRIVDSPIKRKPAKPAKPAYAPPTLVNINVRDTTPLSSEDIQAIEEGAKRTYKEKWAKRIAAMLEPYGISSLRDAWHDVGEDMKNQMRADFNAMKGVSA